MPSILNGQSEGITQVQRRVVLIIGVFLLIIKVSVVPSPVVGTQPHNTFTAYQQRLFKISLTIEKNNLFNNHDSIDNFKL